MLNLPATLTRHEAKEILGTLLEALAGVDGDLVAVDASLLENLDSSALAVLLDCRRHAHAAGKQLEVHGARPKLVELARLYDVDQIVGLVTSAPAALVAAV
jgi:phospholipid transport system transporter-binding protein